MPHPTITALRSLVDSRFPASVRRPGTGLATGIPAIDETLGGGLPPGQLTELVCSTGSGGQQVLAQLLSATRAARQRIALIDATDSFAPEALEPDDLCHLMWARCRNLTETLAIADILVRDGNYAVVVLDLRDVPVRALDRTPKTLWHRLHRIAEQQPAAVPVFSRHGLVPAVRWRLRLTQEQHFSNQGNLPALSLHSDAATVVCEPCRAGFPNPAFAMGSHKPRRGSETPPYSTIASTQDASGLATTDWATPRRQRLDHLRVVAMRGHHVQEKSA